MALAERLLNPPKPRAGNPCSVGHHLATLPPDEAGALQTMLDANWSQDAIYDALTDEGHTVGRQSINRHRTGKCRCAKEAS